LGDLGPVDLAALARFAARRFSEMLILKYIMHNFGDV